MSNIEYLYHYTSIDTLALILHNRTICFNSLLNVDDIDEAKTSDMANFGKYVYVSCWTNDEEESISLWNLYTPNMHGVRIRLPKFPFKRYSFKKGEYFLSDDVDTYIDLKKVYDDNKGSIVANQPSLIPIEYTDDPALLYPTVRTMNRPDAISRYLSASTLDDIKADNLSINYSFTELGKYKSKKWAFQEEWRYILSIGPMGLQESNPPTFEKQKELIHRLESPTLPAPYQRYFLELDEHALSEAEITFGPRMTEAEKILVIALLEKHSLGSQWKDSCLRIR